MRQFKALILVVLLLTAHQQQARADVLGDATALAAQLNPISLALKGLIGEAAGALDDVLQKQLEHLRSIVDMAIRELNEVARQRIDQGDERVRAQIADLNRLVQTNLRQFNALVGKHISTIDSSMRQRINQFNFGLANDLASVKWLPTVPLLMLDGNGITTFKQSGKTTSLFIS